MTIRLIPKTVTQAIVLFKKFSRTYSINIKYWVIKY